MPDEKPPVTPPETTPPPIPETPPETTPPPAEKFWGKFDSADAAKAHYEGLEKEAATHKQFVEAVSPYLRVDEKGNVFYSPKLSEKTDAGDKEPQGPDQADEFAKDPIAFMQKTAREASERAIRLSTDSVIQKRAVIQKFGKEDEFAELEPELDAALAKLPPDVQARPGTAEQVYKLLKADRVDKIVERRVAKAMEEIKKDTKVIGETKVEGAGSGGKSKAGLPSLSDAEKKVAASFGMSEEDYARQKMEIAAGG